MTFHVNKGACHESVSLSIGLICNKQAPKISSCAQVHDLEHINTSGSSGACPRKDLVLLIHPQSQQEDKLTYYSFREIHGDNMLWNLGSHMGHSNTLTSDIIRSSRRTMNTIYKERNLWVLYLSIFGGPLYKIKWFTSQPTKKLSYGSLCIATHFLAHKQSYFKVCLTSRSTTVLDFSNFIYKIPGLGGAFFHQCMRIQVVGPQV